MKLRPLNDRVLVRRIEASETRGGLYLPDVAREKLNRARVLSVSDGVEDIAEGDEIVFGKYSGQELEIDGDECLFVLVEDVLAVVEAGE